METSLNVYDYPDSQEEKEINLQVCITLTTTDTFPKEWEEEEIENYIKANIDEYINESEIETNEIRMWRE